MKNKKLPLIIALVLCLLLPFGVEWLLPNSYSQDLSKAEGIAFEEKGNDIIYRLAGWDGSGDEAGEEEYYEDEYYEEEYYEDEYYEEEYEEEKVYQLKFAAAMDYNGLILSTRGSGECDVLVITPQGETDVYLEPGASEVKIALEGKSGDEIAVQFSDSQRIIERVQVSVVGVMNMHRVMVMLVTLLALYLLYALRGVIGRHLEYGFLIVAAAVMFLFAVLIPLDYALWWDGAIHYEYAYNLGNFWEQAGYGKTVTEWVNEMPTSFFNYVLSGLSIMAGQLLKLSSDAGFMLDRFVNGALYLTVSFLAIRWAGRFKRTIAVTALMPVTLFLAISYSYDVSINSFSFLAFALIVNELCTPNERISLKNGGLIIVSMVLASLAKAVYIPFLALLLLLPGTKFTGKGQHAAFKAGLVLVILMVFASFVLPMMSDPETYTDSRGTSESSVSQLGFILGNLPGFIGMLITNLWNGLLGHLVLEARNYLAYLKDPTTSFNIITLIFSCYVYFTDNDPKARIARLKPLHKWAMGIVSLGVICMTYVVFYVTYTKTGGDVIGGVQFRYFLPVIPFAMAAIAPRNIENRMKKENDHFALLAISLLFCIVMVWRSVLGVYYM